MKKILTTVGFSFMTLAIVAQQKPQYTQYVLNQYIINPAISGIENYVDVKISARDQWVGLSGAPKTSYLTIHAPLGKKDYRTSATSYSIPGENPRGKYYSRVNWITTAIKIMLCSVNAYFGDARSKTS